MRRTLSALACLSLAFGCAPTVYSGGGGICSSTSDCDPGETCRDGMCEPSVGGDGDGGVGGGGADGGGTGGPGDDGGTGGPGDDGGTPPGGGEEICGNGLDDDGDGETDEQCACATEDDQACYGGPAASAGVGVCGMGTQSCVAMGEFGTFGPCEGWTGPSEELCDGLDNDCDGTADEGCGCTTGETRGCYTGPIGTEGVGACTPGSQVCTDGTWGPCDGSVLPSPEVCGDGVDNDCDGFPDDGCGCVPGSTRSCYATPSGGVPGGSPGVGECREGTSTCASLPGGGADWGACTGAVTPASEICANGLDEDCDGAVDEGCVPPTVDCTVADVLLLVDTTGSMGGEIAQIRSRLMDTIIPGLAAEISDIRFAVARFDDFPTGGYGSGADRAFQLVQASTADVGATQAAVNTLGTRSGGDYAESATEALWQSANGGGLGSWVPARSCAAGTVGYPCFRAGAQPIILLFTDAPFHNGPGGSNPYSGISPTPHTYAQAVAELNAINAKVLGLMSDAGARSDLTRIATDTGAVASDGSPIVFDIGTNGASLGTDVVRAVQTLCR